MLPSFPFLLPLYIALDFGLPLFQSLGRFTPISTGCIFLLVVLDSSKIFMHLKILSLFNRIMIQEDVSMVAPLPPKILVSLLGALLMTP